MQWSEFQTRILALPPEQQRQALELIPIAYQELGQSQRPRGPKWRDIARPNQLPPDGDWLIWLILAGRGFGKTRSAAEWVIEESKLSPRIAIVAEDFAAGRDDCVEGESGIKTLLGSDLKWNRSIGEMTFPSGARGKIYSSEDPDSLRGPNNYAAWCDEICKFKNQRAVWDMLMFTLRKGRSKCAITTTPRKQALLKEIMERPTTATVKGRTYDNLANLSPAYIQNIIKPYEGTELGRQELEAEILDDVEGALWKRAMIDAHRMNAPEIMRRVVVGIDPSATAGGDEAGIVTAGTQKVDNVDHYFILRDSSKQGSPLEWAKAALKAHEEFKADAIVAEVNNGGEMVGTTLQFANQQIGAFYRYKSIHASRGKRTRAEPVSALYEQGRVHHVGVFPALEDEMCSWTEDEESPNRMDALVWAITELAGIGGDSSAKADAAPVPVNLGRAKW